MAIRYHSNTCNIQHTTEVVARTVVVLAPGGTGTPMVRGTATAPAPGGGGAQSWAED